MPGDGGPRTIALDGKRVQTRRLAAGLSRADLADRGRGTTDVLSVATIKRAEASAHIFAKNAASLARLLGVPLAALEPDGGLASDRGAGRRPVGAAVAVMPFAIHVGSVDQGVIADGLVEDVINRLASLWFPVIARGSTFSWAGQGDEPIDAPEVLGADYIVRGGLRSDGAKYRISVRLHDARTGLLQWSNGYDLAPDSLFELRDRLVAEIVSEIGNKVLAAEADRAVSAGTVKIDAWHTALRGAWHFHRCTVEDLRQARVHLHRALQEDPGLSFARYLLILSHQHEILNQWTDDPGGTLREMRRCALEFEQVAPGNSWMYVATAYAAVACGDRSEAEERLLQALSLDHNCVQAHSLYGQVLAMGGSCDQGLHELELARTLSPRDPSTWVMVMMTSLAHFAAGRYDLAAESGAIAVATRPHVPFTYAALAAALAQGGDVAAARATLAKLADRHRRLGRRGIAPLVSATDPEIAGRFLDGLRLAGLPDGS